jgi:hypothetical protein
MRAHLTFFAAAGFLGAAALLFVAPSCGSCSAELEAAPTSALPNPPNGFPTLAECKAAGCPSSLGGYALSMCGSLTDDGGQTYHDGCVYYLPSGAPVPGTAASGCAASCTTVGTGNVEAKCRAFGATIACYTVGDCHGALE